MKQLLSAVFSAALLANVFSLPAHATTPVDVTFTVSGAAGDRTYDFSVTNNLGGTNSIYFFGVELPATNIAASPSGWAYAPWDNPWSNAGYGGSSTAYNNPWCCTFGGIAPGQTLSGFKAVDTSASPLNSVNWFAYAEGGTYNGPHFSSSGNPGFEGVATSAVPELSTWAMMLAGFGALGLAGYRRRKDNLAVAIG